MTRADLSGGTEAALHAAMEQMLAMNAQKDKTVRHIVNVCHKLAGTKYTKHYNDVACYVHWNLLKEQGIEVPVQWWKHAPIVFIIDRDTTITWDLKIITDKSPKYSMP
eukprot:10829480-Ditylum_brightwellii.AAC.1